MRIGEAGARLQTRTTLLLLFLLLFLSLDFTLVLQCVFIDVHEIVPRSRITPNATTWFVRTSACAAKERGQILSWNILKQNWLVVRAEDADFGARSLIQEALDHSIECHETVWCIHNVDLAHSLRVVILGHLGAQLEQVHAVTRGELGHTSVRQIEYLAVSLIRTPPQSLHHRVVEVLVLFELPGNLTNHSFGSCCSEESIEVTNANLANEDGLARIVGLVEPVRQSSLTLFKLREVPRFEQGVNLVLSAPLRKVLQHRLHFC